MILFYPFPPTNGKLKRNTSCTKYARSKHNSYRLSLTRMEFFSSITENKHEHNFGSENFPKPIKSKLIADCALAQKKRGRGLINVR